MPVTLFSEAELKPEDQEFIDQVNVQKEEQILSGLRDQKQGFTPINGNAMDSEIESEFTENNNVDPVFFPKPVTPPFPFFVPPLGRTAYYLSPPYDYSSLKQGAAKCWNGSNPVQTADKQKGEILIRTCHDRSSGADEAEASIGSIINDQDGAGGDAYFSWGMITKLDWQFLHPNQGWHTTIAVSVLTELWEWKNNSIANRIFFRNQSLQVSVFEDTRWPLVGSRTELNPRPGTASNNIARTPIPKSGHSTKYLALLKLYHNVTNGPGAAQSKLSTMVWL